MSNSAVVKSPCINQCSLNPATGICTGCFRTIDEIVAWAAMSNEQRIAVIKQLAYRRKAAGKSGENR
jgi:hypothetical protein